MRIFSYQTRGVVLALESGYPPIGPLIHLLLTLWCRVTPDQTALTRSSYSGSGALPGLPSLGKYQRNSSVFEKDTPLLFRTMGGKWSLWVKVQCVVYYDGMLCALHIWHLMDIQIDPFIHLIVIRSSNIVRRFIIIKCTCLLLWQKYSEFK